MMALDLGGNWDKELQRLELSQFLTTKQVWEILSPFEPGAPVSKMDFAKMYKDLNVFNPTVEPIDGKSKKLPSTELGSFQLPGGKEGIGSNNWAISLPIPCGDSPFGDWGFVNP